MKENGKHKTNQYHKRILYLSVYHLVHFYINKMLIRYMNCLFNKVDINLFFIIVLPN